jgi:hypothetical protein
MTWRVMRFQHALEDTAGTICYARPYLGLGPGRDVLTHLGPRGLGGLQHEHPGVVQAPSERALSQRSDTQCSPRHKARHVMLWSLT